jgi:hypothetical protein
VIWPQFAIGLLFVLQGARLSRAAIIAGALHWRLHLVIFAASFVLFPVVGLALRPLSAILLTPPLYLGLLFPLHLAVDGPGFGRLHLDRPAGMSRRRCAALRLRAFSVCS